MIAAFFPELGSAGPPGGRPGRGAKEGGVTSGLHGALLGAATLAALTFSILMALRRPTTVASRMHAVYGVAVAWWFFCMAMVARASSDQQVILWGRLLHLSIGMLPGIVFHLNAVTAGLQAEHRDGIRVHYGLSIVVTLLCLGLPGLLQTPHEFAWGPYPAYTTWGWIPVGLLLTSFAEVLLMFARARRKYAPGTRNRAIAKAFFLGNLVAMLAALDFLPAAGIAFYPMGFLLLTVMHWATMFGSVRYRMIDITPQIAAERVLDAMTDGLIAVDRQGFVHVINESARRLMGLTDPGNVGRRLASLTEAPEILAAASEESSEPGRSREARLGEAEDCRLVDVSSVGLEDESGETLGRVILLSDRTRERAAEAERDKLETWIRQTQKMESLGVMAGGIAHDFNNILMAILGNAEVAQLKLREGQLPDEELRLIGSASERATELTQQMLTYAGKSTTDIRPVDLNVEIREVAELMRAAIPKKIHFELGLAEALPPIAGDPGQIRQVIVNLVTNGSEALGEEAGVLALRSGAGILDEGLSLRPAGEGEEASHVYLEVSDDGCGMDEATRRRIFEPFFTTKFTGRGLGLATVLGIVQRHGGIIDLDSSPGRGARFTVFLPTLAGGGAESVPIAPASRGWRGDGLAVLADDEPAVRRVVRAMIETMGLSVLEASEGGEALRAVRDHVDRVRVVVLDLTMPEMGGREVIEEIRGFAPRLPVLVMSGYAAGEESDSVEDSGMAFLQKPFRAQALEAKIRELLARAGDLGA